jgi:hypothetical protein
MPHYYFDIKDGHTLLDPSGRDCENDNDAMEKARVIAIGVSLDKPAVDPKRHIAVINDAGQEISKVAVYSKPSMSTT